jgi:hypothetical protein
MLAALVIVFREIIEAGRLLRSADLDGMGFLPDAGG